MQELTPVRERVEERARKAPTLHDVFLCHAWDDRSGAARELYDALSVSKVSVWFSEQHLGLGIPMMRAIDKGLANSKAGIVLVTPAFLERLKAEGVADKELSTLLRRELLVPVVHGTTYEALEDVSPLLASRTGLNTTDDSMQVVATKISELTRIA